MTEQRQDEQKPEEQGTEPEAGNQILYGFYYQGILPRNQQNILSLPRNQQNILSLKCGQI